MKKLMLTTAIVLALGLCSFAQQGEGSLRRSKEYQQSYRNDGGGTREGNPTGLALPSGFGQTGDANADANAPLGSGIAVLLGLGAAYMVGKKRREE